jgi:hypothetical protein
LEHGAQRGNRSPAVPQARHATISVTSGSWGRAPGLCATCRASPTEHADLDAIAHASSTGPQRGNTSAGHFVATPCQPTHHHIAKHRNGRTCQCRQHRR